MKQINSRSSYENTDCRCFGFNLFQTFRFKAIDSAFPVWVFCLIISLGGKDVKGESDHKLRIETEIGPVWQSRNEFRIPGDTGSSVELADFSKGPFPNYRFYLTYKLSPRHSFRALYAPLSIELMDNADTDIAFNGENFSAGNPLKARYTFNSYRLAYMYHLKPQGPWTFDLGFSAKIRDAEISLRDNEKRNSYSNMGFVPLLLARAGYQFNPRWRAILDVEGLGAPQGRAIDVAARIHYRLPKGFEIGAGYRTVEGGADNEKVYTFAWLHYFVLNLSYEFF